MKDLFKESIDGLNKLIRQQITYVNEERIGERRCEVSVCCASHTTYISNANN
jgi:hypothetical protein